MTTCVLMNAEGLYMDRAGDFGRLPDAIVLSPSEAAAMVRTTPNAAVIRLDDIRTKRQAGFLLLELLLSMLILCILFSISAPTVARIIQGQQAQAARQRIEMVAHAEQAIAICNTLSDCTPSANAAAIIPGDGSTLITGGYRFTFNATAWLYTATPVNSTGQPTYSIGPDGITQCGGAPCQ